MASLMSRWRFKAGYAQKTRVEGFAFIEVNDGSSLANPCGGAKSGTARLWSTAEATEYGCLGGSGWGAGASVGKGIERKAVTMKVYGEAAETYPLQKKRHSFEFCDNWTFAIAYQFLRCSLPGNEMLVLTPSTSSSNGVFVDSHSITQEWLWRSWNCWPVWSQASPFEERAGE